MHHYLNFKIIATIVLLLAIGGGTAYYYHQPSNNQASQQTSRQANQSQSNIKKRPAMVNHKNTVNKLKSSQSQPVNKPGYTLSVLPKDLQGKWYTYDEGKLETLTITNNEINNGHGVEPIHARPKNANVMKASKHPNWGVALMAKSSVRGIKFLNVRGWNQTAGDGDDFAVLNINGMSVLDLAGGAGASTDANFYRTPQQAKQNKKKIYKNKGEIR